MILVDKIGVSLPTQNERGQRIMGIGALNLPSAANQITVRTDTDFVRTMTGTKQNVGYEDHFKMIVIK